MAKSPRIIQPYPRKTTTGIRRQARSAVRWEKIRQERPRRHARPWKWRTRHDEVQRQEERASDRIRGSLQERIFYQALLDRGFVPNADFTFQSSQLGGRAELGGLVADFLFPEPMVIVQIQSMWHTRTLYHQLRDQDQKMILQSLGYTVLEVWPTTIEDPRALDEWFNFNIMTLWGTSSQGLGAGFGGDTSWADFIDFNLWLEIERKVDDIMRILEMGE